MKLTCTPSVTKIPPPRNIGGGFRSLFSKGDNSPQSLKAVFLYLSVFNWCIFAPITFIMVVLFGQSLGLVAPSRGILTPFNTVTNTVRSIGGGYSILILGITS